MSKYRSKPVVIEATQWFKNGDHPADDCHMIYPDRVGDFGSDDTIVTMFEPYLSEGKVVKHYRGHYTIMLPCRICGKAMHDHGWIDTLEGGHIVCPGDWIITGTKGERYPCKPDVFAEKYEPVVEQAPIEATEVITSYMQKVMDAYKRVTDQREQILQAFVAQYGMLPSEIVAVEKRTPSGSLWYVRKLEDADISA